MKIKHIISCVILGILCIPVFCMKKTQLIQQNFLERKEGSKGRVIYNKLLYCIKSQKEEEKKKEIVSAAAANIINCSIEKVSSSTEAIAQELKLIPYIGKVFGLPGVSSITNFVFKHASPGFYNLEAAKEKKREIQEDIEKVLIERSFRIVEMEGIEDSRSLWFDREIKSFSSDVLEDKKIYAEILCVAADLAKQNKKLFESVLDAAKVTNYSFKKFRVRDWFYDQLANAKDIEEKIIRSYFEEQELGEVAQMDLEGNEKYKKQKNEKIDSEIEEEVLTPSPRLRRTSRQAQDDRALRQAQDDREEEEEEEEGSDGGGCVVM